MKYKVFFIIKSGRITEALCDTLDDVRELAQKYGQIDVYEYNAKGDCYKYLMSVEVL